MSETQQDLRLNDAQARAATESSSWLGREAYVIGQGFASAGEGFKEAAHEAWEHPLTTGIKIGGTAAMAFVLGAAMKQPGAIGTAAKITGWLSMGNFAFDGLKPLVAATTIAAETSDTT